VCTKFRSDRSINGCQTTSGFWKQTDAILDFYFRFQFWPYHRHQHVILRRLPNFIQIGAPRVELWRHMYFSRFFGGEDWGIFSPNGVSRHSNHERHLCVRKHVVCAIKRVRQCRSLTCGEDREKTGQYKKSQKCYISRIWRKPPWNRSSLKFACGVMSRT